MGVGEILLKMNFRGLIMISRLKDRRQKERERKQNDKLRDTKRQRQKYAGRAGVGMRLAKETGTEY